MRKSIYIICLLVLLTGCSKKEKELSVKYRYDTDIKTPIILNAKGDLMFLSVPDCGNTLHETDLSKYIVCSCDVLQDMEPNYRIKVMEYLKNTDLSKQTAIMKPENYTVDSIKGKDSFARVIGDKIVYVTSQDEEILHRLIESVLNTEPIENNSEYIVGRSIDTTVRLGSIPKVDYESSVELQPIVSNSVIGSMTTSFEDGLVVGQRRLSTFEESINTYATLLRNISGREITEYYLDKGKYLGVFYATSGEYTVAVESYNINTQLVYLGVGEVARDNILLELE